VRTTVAGRRELDDEEDGVVHSRESQEDEGQEDEGAPRGDGPDGDGSHTGEFGVGRGRSGDEGEEWDEQEEGSDEVEIIGSVEGEHCDRSRRRRTIRPLRAGRRVGLASRVGSCWTQDSWISTDCSAVASVRRCVGERDYLPTQSQSQLESESAVERTLKVETDGVERARTLEVQYE
jgi:hypothetical protein